MENTTCDEISKKLKLPQLLGDNHRFPEILAESFSFCW